MKLARFRITEFLPYMDPEHRDVFINVDHIIYIGPYQDENESEILVAFGEKTRTFIVQQTPSQVARMAGWDGA